MSVLAIDIDLGRITAVHSIEGVICHGADPLNMGAGLARSAAGSQVTLIEIAGPIMHHEESHSHRRWMLYNVAVASMLSIAWAGKDVRVATSTDWTKGYSELERDAVAGIRPVKHKTVTRQKAGKTVVTREPLWAENHDVRECRCMLYFYARDPKPWKPLDQYLKSLCGK